MHLINLDNFLREYFWNYYYNTLFRQDYYIAYVYFDNVDRFGSRHNMKLFNESIFDASVSVVQKYYLNEKRKHRQLNLLSIQFLLWILFS